MFNYFYIAKSFSGETQSGNIAAKDIHELAQMLKDKGLVLVNATPEIKKKRWHFSFFSFKVSLAEKIMLTKNLWMMLSAGLPMVKSFNILAEQSRNRKLKSALMEIGNAINKGSKISEALAKYPHIFSDIYQNMVKAGEESGTLEESLEILTVQLEKEHGLKSKVRNAMAYPIIVLLAMAAIGMFMVVIVLPRFDELFRSLNIKLPVYTRITLGIGNFALHQWYILLGVFLILMFVLIPALRTKTGKWLKDTLFLRLPFFSGVIKKNNAAVFTRSLSSLSAAGVPLLKSLEICEGILGNVYFKRALEEAVEKVKKGERLSDALLSHQKIFPFGSIEMIQIGEETGKTSSILKKLAEFYEGEVISDTEKFSILLEPILIIVLGIVVGFFAVSIIEPMYSSLNALMGNL